MTSASTGDRQHSALSDDELLRRIGRDLRDLYAEVIRQPLPPNIQATLARIDRERSRDHYSQQRVAC